MNNLSKNLYQFIATIYSLQEYWLIYLVHIQLIQSSRKCSQGFWDTSTLMAARVSCSSEWPWACDSWTLSHYELASLLMTWLSGRVQGWDEVTQHKVHPVISTGWSFGKGIAQKKTERHKSVLLPLTDLTMHLSTRRTHPWETCTISVLAPEGRCKLKHLQSITY